MNRLLPLLSILILPLLLLPACTPGKITQMTRKGHTLFVYSDPRKKLLLVGANPQFERYQHILYSKVVIPDQAADKEDKLLADDYAGWGGMMDPFFGPMMMY